MLHAKQLVVVAEDTEEKIFDYAVHFSNEVRGRLTSEKWPGMEFEKTLIVLQSAVSNE